MPIKRRDLWTEHTLAIIKRLFSTSTDCTHLLNLKRKGTTPLVHVSHKAKSTAQRVLLPSSRSLTRARITSLVANNYTKILSMGRLDWRYARVQRCSAQVKATPAQKLKVNEMGKQDRGKE